MDEDFLAAYQMNYGFTPDGEQADTTATNMPGTSADELQTSNNQVSKYMCTWWFYGKPHYINGDDDDD